MELPLQAPLHYRADSILESQLGILINNRLWLARVEEDLGINWRTHPRAAIAFGTHAQDQYLQYPTTTTHTVVTESNTLLTLRTRLTPRDTVTDIIIKVT